jgi:hypothetical protein
MAKKCQNCKQELPEEAVFCLHCFKSLNTYSLDDKIANEINVKQHPTKSKVICICVIAIVILSIITTSLLVESHNNKVISVNAETVTNNISIATENTKTTVKQDEVNTTTQPTTTTQQTSSTQLTSETQSTTTEQTTLSDTTATTTTKATTKVTTTVSSKVVIEKNVLVDYPSNKKSESYSIPYSVTKISANAFNNNKYLKSLKFSKQENIDCDFENLFKNLPNLETVYIYPGTNADLEGLKYFDGEIVYYD